MDKQNSSPQRHSCRILGLILAAAAAELMLFSLVYPYPTGRVILAIWLQPLVINLLLMRPDGPPKPLKDLPPAEEAGSRFKRLFSLLYRKLRSLIWAFLTFCSGHFHLCNALLGGAFLAGCSSWFWKQRVPYFQHPVSICIPMVYAGGFFLLLVLEIWCRHMLKGTTQTEDRFSAIIRNLHSEIRINKFLCLGLAVTAAMPMLGLPQFYRQYYRILCWYLGIQTAFLILFYGIRAAKGELLTNPDLRVLVLHRDRKSVV